MKIQLSQQRLLTIAITVAIIVHVIGITWVHGMRLATYLATRPPLERHADDDSCADNSSLRNRHRLVRDHQLKTVFEHLQPAVTTPKSPDYHSLKPNTRQQIHADVNVALQTPAQDLSTFLQPTIDATVALAALFPDANAVANELIRATDLLPGTAHNRSAQETSTPTAGYTTTATLPEMSATRRSGATDAGRKNTDTSAVAPAPTASSVARTAGWYQDDSLSALIMAQGGPPVTGNDEIDRLATIASSNDFKLMVEYAPKADGTGYLFRLAFVPKRDVRFKRIRQNLFFLIDRSSSIGHHRYQLSKQAVAHALHFLKKGDTFNIIVFDDKVVRMVNRNILATEENISKAHAFLDAQNFGGLFSGTDIYASLERIIPKAVADQEVNTAILLSDGNTLLSNKRQRDTIRQWTERNEGKVSLFSVAAGYGNSIALLDLLSANNKGVLAYTQSPRDLTTALVNLMRSIHNPIGKDIVVSIVADSKNNVVVYPRPARFPNLYEHRPYVLYGSTDRLEPFHAFLQGRYYDHWLDIGQVVNFTEAQQVAIGTLAHPWLLHSAYDLYDKYLVDGNLDHIAQVRRLLGPIKMPVAFH